MTQNYEVQQEKNGAFSVAANVEAAPAHGASGEHVQPESAPLLVTMVLIAINVVVWLVQLTKGIDWLDPTPDHLVAWGGNLAVLTLTGESWRLLTNIFLHGGAVHLLMNMYMLLAMGPYIQRSFGRTGLIGIYLVGGLWASFVTAFWTGLSTLQPTPFSTMSYGLFGGHTIKLIVSVGASGAIMALCGALLVSAFSSDQDHYENTDFRNSLLRVIGLNLVSGFFITGIDQAAHVGGVLAGLILGAAFGTKDGSWNAFRHIVRIVLVSLLACGALMFWLHAGNWTDLQEIRKELHRADNPAEAARDDRRARTEERAEEERANLPVPVSDAAAKGRVLPLGAEATAMAISDDERLAYVVSNKSNQLLVLDLASGKVTQRIAGPDMPITDKDTCIDNFCKGQGAVAVTLLSKRNLALVPSMHPDSLSVIDLSAGKVINVIPLGRFPRAMAISPDQDRAYIENAVDNTVSVVDLNSWKVIQTLALEKSGRDLPFGRPLSLWLDDSNSRLFVVNAPDHTIEAFDTRTLQQVHYDIPLEWFDRMAPYTAEPNKIWGFSHSTVQVLEPEPYKIERVWEFCQGINADRFAVFQENPNTSLIAVSDPGIGFIWTANPDSGVTHGIYPVQNQPAQLQFSKDGKSLFALGSEGTLSIIDLDRRMDASERNLLCTRPEDSYRES